MTAPLGFLTAIHGRHELAALVLAHTEEITRHLPARRLVAVVSDDQVEAVRAYAPAPWEIVSAPNRPLGAKWNAGLEPLLNCRSVVTLGSDDLLSKAFIDRLVHLGHAWAPDYAGALGCHVLNAQTGELRFWPGYSAASGRAGETIGTGRRYSARILGCVTPGSPMWGPDLDFGLDYYARTHHLSSPLLTHEELAVVPHRIDVLDVKAYPGVDIGDFYTFDGSVPVALADLDEPSRAMVARALAVHEKRMAEEKKRHAVRIGAAIIARECEETIERAVRTALSVCEEAWVIVDERSTDETAARALSSGARVTWQQFLDFSQQRNFAVASVQSESACDWALILDGDEWIEDPGELRAAAANVAPDVNAIMCAFRPTPDSTPFAQTVTFQPRLIRTSLRYKFPAHHVLDGEVKPILARGLVMEKYGDPKPSAERAVRMLSPLLESENAEERAHAAHYVSRSLATLGRYEEALKVADRCPDQDAGSWLLQADLREKLYGLTNYSAWDAIKAAVHCHPDLPDANYLAARFYFARLLETLTVPKPEYVTVPQRWPRYMPDVEAAARFFGLKLGPRA